ncbi:uncharacterized protein LOC141915295 isoform X2 [Tubulanus polymorphus]|uniref:uncharacterized protein LOC141900694 isoform X2 n=1 Tax=Tubulanus polymorphus TaxID=672921 RepID=UPI003DA47540
MLGVIISILEAYGRNNDFRGPAITLPQETVPEWPTCGFKQLTNDHKIVLPKFNIDTVTAYFTYRMAMDNHCTKDIKAIEKGQQLIESQRVQACSILIKSGIVYLTGLVGAAMKKKISYSYQISLSQTTGEFRNSHCECPAGKGPNGTCKHVAAVLLMFANFVSSDGPNAPEILKSCTENLQTFHKPKSVYTGSPVKAGDLPLSKSKKREVSMEDPRPVKYRKSAGYEDYVRGIVLNYCSVSSLDLPIKYKYKKADIKTAAIDHDYLKKTLLEYWVENSIKLNETQAILLERSTRKQAESSQWFQERQLRLTASRFGEIVSLTKRRNIDKLCKSLHDNIPLRNAAVCHGKTFESKAIAAFEGKFSVKVQPCGLHVRPDIDYLGASPDGLVSEDAIVEVKCPYRGRNELIAPGPYFKFLSAKDKKLKRSHNYYDQIQGQLHICKRKMCYFVVYTHKDLYVERVYHDQKHCELSLLPKLEIFYRKYYSKYLTMHAF